MRDELGLHVLALDWSDVQSEGAARKDASRSTRKGQQRLKTARSNVPDDAVSESLHPDEQGHNSRQGSLTYVTTRIDQGSLLSTTDDWLAKREPGSHVSSTPVPILFVALHACGSLTPDILRAFLTALKTDKSSGTSRPWQPCGAVVVGCCYNMMTEQGMGQYTVPPVHVPIPRRSTY